MKAGREQDGEGLDGTGRQDYAVPALEKGLDILELLSAERVPLTQADVARALGRTSSEIFRMLVLLERRGYIRKDPASGQYALTLRLFALAHAHNPLEELIQAARGPMRLLAEVTRESCHLGVLRREELLVVAQAEAPIAMRLSIEVGGRFPIEETTSGRLITALMPDVEYARTFGRDKPADLQEIARRGFLSEPSWVLEGVHNYSVPVLLPGEVAALTVCQIAGRGAPAKSDQILEAAFACAKSMRAVLGWPEG